MNERIIVSDRDSRTAERLGPSPVAERVGALAVAAGVAIGTVGLIDLALVWYPPQFNSMEWEFGAVSGTFDALPLPTIGAGLLCAGLYARQARWPLYLLGGLFALVIIGLVAALAIYLLDVPIALRSLPEQLRPPLRYAMAKTLLMGVVFVAFYGWLTWHVFRTGRRARALP